jgi:hypothetical protein
VSANTHTILYTISQKNQVLWPIIHKILTDEKGGLQFGIFMKTPPDGCRGVMG